MARYAINEHIRAEMAEHFRVKADRYRGLKAGSDGDPDVDYIPWGQLVDRLEAHEEVECHVFALPVDVQPVAEHQPELQYPHRR